VEYDESGQAVLVTQNRYSEQAFRNRSREAISRAASSLIGHWSLTSGNDALKIVIFSGACKNRAFFLGHYWLAWIDFG
jgi:hypothetical protein